MQSFCKQNNNLKNFKMQNHYETVFIVTPVLSEAQVKETVAKFKKIITDRDGEIYNEENWGLKKLAYPIVKKSSGFYVLFNFKVEGSAIAKLETEMKRDEAIIRFLTVKQDKYAVEYTERRIKKNKAE